MRKSLFTLLFLFLSNVASADVKAFLNQDSFYEGDPITLTIESNGTGNNKNAQPNLNPLNKDFQVLGTSTSMQVNIRNGHKRVKKSWTVELLPQRKGKLQIPAIQIGQLTTSPVSLSIIDIPVATEKEISKHVFVESSVDIAGNQPYVQQQIPYTVKLYYDSSMQNGKIYSPTVENAIVEQLGEDRRYRTIRMGKKYSVVEKHFVISPEKSGTLHIPPTSVKGRLTINNSRNQNRHQRRRDDTDFMNRFFNSPPFGNDPFFKDLGDGFFSSGRAASKPFTSSSKAIDVEVQPLPQAFTGQLWLPAEELEIKDSWAMTPPELRVGEPVTRTLRLQAKGLAGSQIPKIDIPKPANIRIYPEQAKSETRTDGKTVYGISEMHISYIPDAQGKISIPEIKLDWWNVVTKKQETFILPKWDLIVAAGTSGPQVDALAGKPVFNALPETSEPAVDSSTITAHAKEKPPATAFSNSTLKGLLSTLLLLLLAMFAYFYIYKRKRAPVKTQQAVERIEAALQHACEANHQDDAAKHLLALVNASWEGKNPPQNLGSLAAKVIQGKEAILALERSLYAKETTQWNGSHLWAAVKEGLVFPSVTKQKHSNTLKPLYPIQ